MLIVALPVFAQSVNYYTTKQPSLKVKAVYSFEIICINKFCCGCL